MGQATAPRVQALISTSDNEWIKKHKPKGETVSKFVASLIAEAINDKERRKKIGAESGDAIHNLVVDIAAQLEDLNNLCRYYNRQLKDDIRHHLDGTQFEDGLLYDAFVLNSSAPAVPTSTEAPKTITGAIEAAKKKGFTHQVVAKKAEQLPSDDAETLRLKLLGEVLEQLKQS